MKIREYCSSKLNWTRATTHIIIYREVAMQQQSNQSADIAQVYVPHKPKIVTTRANAINSGEFSKKQNDRTM